MSGVVAFLIVLAMTVLGWGVIFIVANRQAAAKPGPRGGGDSGGGDGGCGGGDGCGSGGGGCGE
ncbi:hypothetical protein J7F03_24415 [Streptomyces sp. ISL-43]|uniref:hypothetical protein n=1 Tax=Streptomyces sp. ISL-43 TaxID=2819183 RepID=UPI001BE9BE7A|nr:hypothetical protein [Streptomyces sp. ISL-43]MBT2450163.1 hypothetical protein [Streptomyces sp. ISL-43]